MSDLWENYWDSWELNLRARNVADSTIEAYERSLTGLAAWAKDRPAPIYDPLEITKRDMVAYFAAERDRPHKRTGKPISAAFVAKNYRHLKVFFGWLAEDEDAPNPMAKIPTPIVPEKPTPIFQDDQLRALLKACAGKTFENRRDTAIVRILFDGGLRRGELAALTLPDVNLRAGTLQVHGKGRRERLVVIGVKTCEAIDRYLRARSRHPDAALDALWLSGGTHRGPLGYTGIGQLLDRLATRAGVDGVHPHRFRHTAYDAMKDAGGDDGTAMSQFGWNSRAMPDHYAKSNAARRAQKAMRRLSPGDRI